MEQPPAPPPAPAEKKKGLPPLAWAGIGCGTLVLVAIVVALVLLIGWCRRTVDEFQENPERATARMVVKMNPELEMVREDEAAGTITVRTKDGEEMTLGYADIAEGRITFTDADGNVAGTIGIDEVPAWVPRVPGLDETVLAGQSVENGKTTGFYAGTSTAGAEEIERAFLDEAQTGGFSTTTSNTVTLNDVVHRTVNISGGGRELTLSISGKEGEPLQVRVGYNDTP